METIKSPCQFIDPSSKPVGLLLCIFGGKTLGMFEGNVGQNASCIPQQLSVVDYGISEQDSMHPAGIFVHLCTLTSVLPSILNIFLLVFPNAEFILYCAYMNSKYNSRMLRYS